MVSKPQRSIIPLSATILDSLLPLHHLCWSADLLKGWPRPPWLREEFSPCISSCQYILPTTKCVHWNYTRRDQGNDHGVYPWVQQTHSELELDQDCIYYLEVMMTLEFQVINVNSDLMFDTPWNDVFSIFYCKNIQINGCRSLWGKTKGAGRSSILYTLGMGLPATFLQEFWTLLQ